MDDRKVPEKVAEFDEPYTQARETLDKIKSNNSRLAELFNELDSIKIVLKVDDKNVENDWGYRALQRVHAKKITAPKPDFDPKNDKLSKLLKKLSAVRVELEKDS